MLVLIRFFPLLLTALVQAATPNYLTEIKPIFDKRCAVCHSCYNSPCQLKLDSFEGLDRGGSKKTVYSGSRLYTQEPSRLFIDAATTQQWRKKGFFSVSQKLFETNASIMRRMVDLKVKNPVVKGSYEAESDDLTCAENKEEIESYEKKHPHGGMPFGFPPLSDSEYAKIISWLNSGAKGPSPEEQKALIRPSAAAQIQIDKWESFFNNRDPKYRMSARYLYEHLFLAHIHFEGTKSNEFYELVRSSTPSPKPIQIIATVRPYDDPKSETFYYRFQKIHSTIVHKTHLVFPLGDKDFARITKLFIEPEWLEKPHFVGYDDSVAANPFIVYAQIPPKSRYQFLLDHSQYVVDTFIRGPVCKGQIALNVIEDHFWVLFMDPKYDFGVKNPKFLLDQSYNLALPTEIGSEGKLWDAFSDEYRDRYEAFYHEKMKLYATTQPNGLPIEAIWKGESAQDAPALTVYRHFDSASVHRGVIGELPKTLWMIDYPQFERIYYALVAGFDVFGNITHQTNVRRYMDYLRMEGEMNFLQLIPRAQRYDLLKSWYLGTEIENVRFETFGNLMESNITYYTDDPKRELIERAVDTHLLPSAKIAFDNFNYFRANEPTPKMPQRFTSKADYVQGLRSLTLPGTGFIKEVNEFGVDVLHLRIRNTLEGDRYLSIVINRWHDNVNALFRERSRLNPNKDTIDFFTYNIGSYPNYFFDVDFVELADFMDMMANYDGSAKYKKKIEKYGINRSNPRFWEIFDDFQNQFYKSEPMESGLYDLNRYYHQAF